MTRAIAGGPGAERRLRAATALAAALWLSPALAQENDPTDDERRDADCIDRFNDPEAVEPGDAAFAGNPYLLHVFGAVGGAAATQDDRAGARGLLLGARVELETPVVASALFIHSGSTETGISVGVVGRAFWVRDQSGQGEVELRLGLKRRRFQPEWSTVSWRCRRMRTDIGVDLLRWHLGGFTDEESAGHPSVFTSSVALPAISYRWASSTWGFAVGAAPFEFRLAPSFDFGSRLEGEIDIGGLAFQLELRASYVPDWSIAVIFGFGAGLDLGGGS